MYKTLTKNGQLFAFGLGLLVTIIFLASVFSGIEDFNGLSKEGQYETGIFNFGIQAVIFLTVVCLAAMVLFGLYQVFSDLKGSIKGLAGFGVLLAIFGISYATATPETGERWQTLFDTFNVTPGASKFISGAITTALSMIGIAIVIFILSEIRNFFK